MQNVRLKYLDIARGIGIFLVVLGHSMLLHYEVNREFFRYFMMEYIFFTWHFSFIFQDI